MSVKEGLVLFEGNYLKVVPRTDFDAKVQECAEYQRALSEAQTVEGELRARLRDEQDSHTQTHVELAELQARTAAAERQRDAAVAVFDMVTRIPTMSSDELAQLIANCRQAIDAELGGKP